MTYLICLNFRFDFSSGRGFDLLFANSLVQAFSFILTAAIIYKQS